MSIRKQFAQAATVVAILGFAAGPAAAQDGAPPAPSTPVPEAPPTPDGPPPSAPTTPPASSGQSCKGKKGKAKQRCKNKPRSEQLFNAAATGPRYQTGNTDCHTTPFAGTDTQQPLVSAADGGPSVDSQWVRIETFRYRWNGNAWAYETTIDNSWVWASDRGFSTQYDTGGRWQTRGTYGTGATSGYYRIAQRITWIPTKSAPQEYGVFRFSPLTQNGTLVSYCTF